MATTEILRQTKSTLRKIRGIINWKNEWEQIEFGDKFWKNATREKYKHGQYIHIPKLSEIKQQIAHAGFELVIYEWRNIIAPEDLKLKSGNTLFFVCRSLKA